MEYMDRGSLAEILSCDHPIPEQHIAYVCRCLLSALDALHSQNRIHRGIYKTLRYIGKNMAPQFGSHVFAVYDYFKPLLL